MLSYVPLHFLQTFKNLWNCFQVIETYMTCITIDNVQRAVTPKAGNSELECFGNCIKVMYSGMKFQENISNSFQVTEWTQMYYRNHYFAKFKGP